MSYQTAIDLNYSELLNFSESEFTQPGPGALRGLRKCFESLGDHAPADVILWMVENQEQEMARLGLPFGGLWGRPLQAIDCQSLFCETDKYCREAAPELASARKRIKARFSRSTEPISLFFPPKWGLNEKLPAAAVFGEAPPDRAPSVHAASSSTAFLKSSDGGLLCRTPRSGEVRPDPRIGQPGPDRGVPH